MAVLFLSKHVIIIEMLHDILNAAMQDITKPVYGIHLNILIMSQPIKLRTVDMISRIKVILRDPLSSSAVA